MFAKLDIRLSNKDRRQTADLKVKVDTGAQGNILPLRIFRRMFPEKLTAEGYPSHGAVAPRSNTTLSAYNGSKIPQYGSISLPCRYSTSEWVNAEFYIADTDGPAILGLPNSRQLQLVTLHCAIDKDTRSTRDMDPVKSVQELKEQYPDRFDSLGQFPGTYHIVTDPTVQPMIHSPRKCPIQMKDELQSALDKMTQDNDIRKVIEPTDWVSSLAFSRKKDGTLRIFSRPEGLKPGYKAMPSQDPNIGGDNTQVHWRNALLYAR